MTTTIPNKNIVKSFSETEEFEDPNLNYKILLAEMRERIVDLQYDLNNIKDPEVYGFAVKLYIQLKNRYFDLMVQAMHIEHNIVSEQALSVIAQSLGGEENE